MNIKDYELEAIVLPLPAGAHAFSSAAAGDVQ